MPASIIVSAAVVDGEKILLVQEGKEHCRGQWSLPGGRVEPGEPLVDAVVREVFEETGYQVRVVGMTRVLRYISQLGFHCVRFNFIAERIGGEPRIDGMEILNMEWRSFDDVDRMNDADLRTPAIARATIDDVRRQKIHPLDIVLDALAPLRDL
jgi:ADP-ribose pyrophosphatase YjhB (NUDIX family)